MATTPTPACIGLLSASATVLLGRLNRNGEKWRHKRIHHGDPDFFGDYCRWHPHIHAIVSGGLYTESAYFFVLPQNADIQFLKEILRARVFAMLKKEGLVRMILSK
ncbi:MAG: hypothetical protein M8357_07800 [Desulfobulbaceae bacterium]|nr:hypothetical protein [Desulfobulbaceae bacterium]